jgi:hypothetical protein
MGGNLYAQAGQQIEMEAQISGCQGDSAELIEGNGQGSSEPAQNISGDHASLHWTVKAGATRGWFFVEVRDSSGQIVLVGNPIYVNWSSAQGASQP